AGAGCLGVSYDRSEALYELDFQRDSTSVNPKRVHRPVVAAWLRCVLNVSDTRSSHSKCGGGPPGQDPSFPTEMSLVGVAGLESQLRQAGKRRTAGSQECLEAQHPLEQFRPVTDPLDESPV